MKKLIIIMLLTTAIIADNGCKKYVDGNDTNPNQPSVTTPALLLSSAEVATFANLTGELSRLSAVLVQQGNGNSFQLSDVGSYVLREGDDDNEFQSLYTDAMINDQTLITQFGDKNRIYRGVGEVLKAMALGILTDTWGDVPNKEALNGLTGKYTPHFDKQQDIYTNIQQLLDSAVVDLQTTDVAHNVAVPGTDDFVFGGDNNKWTTIAYILKARYHNHLSKKDPSGSATSALADIANAVTSGATSPAIDANAVFGSAGNNQNSYYQYTQARGGYLKTGKTFVDLLQAANDTDPRLPFFVALSVDSPSVYKGTTQAIQDPNASEIGTYYNSATAPLPLVTYVEMKFIEAEANARLGHNAAAAAASNAAVQASVLQVTGAAASGAFITNHASLTGSESDLLKRIMTEKYKALYLQYESWTDWRRTGFPVLTPNPTASIPAIPRRLPTSLTERQYNPNAASFIVTDVTVPVWWDAP